jgi:hypothetical protein
LAPTLGQSIFVLAAERCLGLGLSFTWGHTTSVVRIDSSCKPPTAAGGTEQLVAATSVCCGTNGVG